MLCVCVWLENTLKTRQPQRIFEPRTLRLRSKCANVWTLLFVLCPILRSIFFFILLHLMLIFLSQWFTVDCACTFDNLCCLSRIFLSSMFADYNGKIRSVCSIEISFAAVTFPLTGSSSLHNSSLRPFALQTAGSRNALQIRWWKESDVIQ